MTGLLLEPLTPDQEKLLRVIYEPFGATGDWPVWQYAALKLEAMGIDAAEVLASLPVVGDPQPMGRSYGLAWRMDPHLAPKADVPVVLTVAGLRHLTEARPLLATFLAALTYMLKRQKSLVPNPAKVVEATVSSEDLRAHLIVQQIGGRGGPDQLLLKKLRMVIGHEPLLGAIVHQPQQNVEQWSIRVPAALRAYRGVESVDDFVDRATEVVDVSAPPSVPFSAGPLEIPYAIDYLDAVWKAKTGSRLFMNLNPASIARLTLPCGGEEEFNSLMSALADVLAQVVTPGTARPPQRAALEQMSAFLAESLDPDAAERASAALDTLVRLRHIRVSTQHADARHKAVTAFAAIGLPFPPASWDLSWAHIATMAISALNALREEVHAGLPEV